MTAPGNAVVELRDVSKRFERGNTVALRGIDLAIESGEFVSLIGPSGCGKSTLLRIIGDLVEPSTGRVTVNGKTAHQARVDRDYGIVFQSSVLFDWRTVTTNIVCAVVGIVFFVIVLAAEKVAVHRAPERTA